MNLVRLRLLNELCFWLIWLLLAHICLCASNSTSEWPDVSVKEQVAIRTERDMQNNITIDQIPFIGVNLKSVLFNQETNEQNIIIDTTSRLNNTDSLNNFSSLLNQGTSSFILDIENINNTWVIVNTSILLEDFLTVLTTFLDDSDNNLSANILMFFLRITAHIPDTYDDDNSILLEIFNSTITGTNSTTEKTLYQNSTVNQNLNLTSLIERTIGCSYIYKPKNLLLDNKITNTTDLLTFTTGNDTKWPTLETFLYEKRNRILITELSSTLNQSTSPFIFPNTILHFDTINSTLSCPSEEEEFKEVQSVQWRFLEAEFSTHSIFQYMQCGLSPIITNSFSISNITDIVPLLGTGIVWSWKTNEPRLTNSKLLMGKDSLQAYNCAVIKYISSNGSVYWQVDNCYAKKNMLCQSKNNPFKWTLSEDKHEYFAYFDDQDGDFCPENYTFSLPTTLLEQRSVSLYLEEIESENMKIWINLNSIAVSNCWLIGGTGLSCPYSKSVSHRNFVAMLTSVSVIAAALLSCVLYLSLLSVPIHDNRKNWRRVVNKISKSEIEGVPS